MTTDNHRIPSIRLRVVAPTLAGAAVFLGTAAIGWAMSPSDQMDIDDWQVLIAVGGGVPVGLCGAIWTMLLQRREMKRQMTVFLAETLVSGAALLAVVKCRHCRGLYPRFFGGFLALTDKELVFQTGLAEFRYYERRIPLQDIDVAQSCRIDLFLPGLKVMIGGDRAERFLFPGAGWFAELVNHAREKLRE